MGAEDAIKNQLEQPNLAPTGNEEESPSLKKCLILESRSGDSSLRRHITYPTVMAKRRETLMKYSSGGKKSLLTTFHKETTQKVIQLGFFSFAFALWI